MSDSVALVLDLRLVPPPVPTMRALTSLPFGALLSVIETLAGIVEPTNDTCVLAGRVDTKLGLS